MKLSLDYTWDCDPAAFWALYYDPDFAVRLHLDHLGSTSAEVVSQEGDLRSGLVRTLRYGQRPNMPGPVRKIFGEEVVTTEVSTYDPATTTTTFTMTPGTMADKTQIDGRIALADGTGSVEHVLARRPSHVLRRRPVVKIEQQARDMQGGRSPSSSFGGLREARSFDAASSTSHQSRSRECSEKASAKPSIYAIAWGDRATVVPRASSGAQESSAASGRRTQPSPGACCAHGGSRSHAPATSGPEPTGAPDLDRPHRPCGPGASPTRRMSPPWIRRPRGRRAPRPSSGTRRRCRGSRGATPRSAERPAHRRDRCRATSADRPSWGTCVRDN